MTLLLACLLAADDVADAVKRLRAAADLAERYQAEYALGQALKAPQIPLVLKEIDAGPAELRPHFIRAIRQSGGAPAIAALKGLLARHEMKSRVEAAYALKILGEIDGMKALVVEVQSPKLSKDDKLAILTYLYSYYYDGKEAPAVLRKILENEKDKDVRQRALLALGSHKDPESAALLAKIADDESDPLRYEALAALIRTGDPSAVERGLSALEKGKLPTAELYAILFALRTAGGADVAARLRAMLDRTDDVNVRTQIIYTLSQLKDAKSIPLLLRLMEDKNASVAEAAITALIELAGKAHLETIRKLLNHASADRRLKAAEALVGLDDRSGIPVLRAILEEKTPYYRQRAATALGTCACRESIEALLWALSDEDLSVRQAAATGIVSALSALYPYRRFDLAKVGYDAKSDSQSRAAAIARIKEWWQKNP